MDNWYDWHRPDRPAEKYTAGYYWRAVLGFNGQAKE